jgi:hypothetical protein
VPVDLEVPFSCQVQVLPLADAARQVLDCGQAREI